jgi:hypothetical protein
MADLNALIAQGYQFQAPPDPFVQYGKRQQLELGEQTNQLNQMKMQEAQAAVVKRNALSGLDPSSPDYENQLFKLDPTMGMAYRKDASTVAAQKATQEKQNTDAAAARQGILGQAFRDISSRPSDANITAHLEDVQASSLFKPEEKAAVQKLSQTLLSMPFGERGSFLASQGAKSSDLIAKPEPGFTLSPGQTRYPAGYSGVVTSPAAMPVVAAEPTTNEIKNAKAIALGAGPEGSPEYNQSLQTQLLRLTDKPVATAAAATSTEMKNADAFALLKGPAGSPAYNQEYVKQLARLTAKSEGAAATPAAPVAVVGSDGKVKYVSREEAISKGMTPASAMEGLAPKEIQNREAKYPMAKRATATVSATMTEIENTIDRLLANENGLNGITGFVGGRTYAVTDAARKAEADLKQLKNLAFVQGLTELRNASSTGAGVGNVSNKEGDRFENLKASLEQTQSTSDLKDSLKRLKSQSTSTRDTVNQAFEDTYAYRANAPAVAAKPSGGGAPPLPPGFKRDN